MLDKVDIRPHRIKCPDCSYVADTFTALHIHWLKAWRSPRRFGKHWKPRRLPHNGREPL